MVLLSSPLTPYYYGLGYRYALIRNVENFYISQFTRNMVFRANAYRASALNFNNFRNIHLAFTNNSFTYKNYTARFSNIDTIYATQGSVNLNFTGMKKNVAIVTGAGDDVVHVGRGKVDVNMGAGDDVLNIGSVVNNSEYDGGQGSDTVVFTNKNVNATLTDSQVAVGQTSATLNNFSTFKATKGNARLNFLRMTKNVSIYTGAGNDTVTLGRGRSYVNLGQGDDTAIVERAHWRSSISGGLGYDTLKLTAKNVSAALSNTKVNIGLGQMNLTGMEAVVATSGNVSIDVSHVTKNFDVTTGAGNDKVYLGTGAGTIETDAGDDTIFVRGALGKTKTIDAGTGYNTLDISGPRDTITINEKSLKIGRSQAKLYGIDALNVSSGQANIDAQDLKGALSITTGRWRDYILLGGGSTVVDAGRGYNSITLLGTGEHYVTTGRDDDTYFVSRGTMHILDKGGDNTFSIVADGVKAAQAVDITLEKPGDNTFNIHDVTLADFQTATTQKAWLEDLDFDFVAKQDGSADLSIAGFGTTQLDLHNVQEQDGLINVYVTSPVGYRTYPQIPSFSIDFGSVVEALQDGGAQAGLTFNKNGHVWKASVAEELPAPTPDPAPAPDPDPAPSPDVPTMTINGGTGNDTYKLGQALKVVDTGGKDSYSFNLATSFKAPIHITDQGEEADTFTFFGVDSETPVATTLGNLSFTLTQDTDTKTLSISGLVPNQAAFSITQTSFEGDTLEFNTFYQGQNTLLASVDLEALATELDKLNNKSGSFTFTQDSTTPTKYNVAAS